MMDYFPEEGLIKCIDGIRRDESKIIAHCTSSLHPGPLTYQLMKKHKCIKKKCGNLRIVPAAEYWQQKKRAKEKRLQRREETKSGKILEQDILDFANDTVKDMPDVSFVRIRQHPHGFYYLFYVSDKFIDLSGTAKALHKEFHVRIFLRKSRT